MAAAPALVCTAGLVVLAIFAVFYVGQFTGRGVSPAVVDSQRQLVGSIARGLSLSISRSMDELTSGADRYAADSARDPRKLLAGLSTPEARWRGLSVVDNSGRTALATAGAGAPADGLPAHVTEPTVIPKVDRNDPRLVLVVPLLDGRLLLAEADLGMRSLRLNPEARQAILVALPDGRTALAQGVEMPPADPARAILGELIADTAGKRIVSRTGAVGPGPSGTPGPGPRASGPTPSAPPGPVASGPMAPLLTAAVVGHYGFSVVSVVRAPVSDAGSHGRAIPAGAGLLLAAGLVLWILLTALVRPIRRILGRAKAVACGDTAAAQVRSRTAEIRRISSAVEDLAAGRSGAKQSRRTGIPAALAVFAAVAIVAGSAGVIAVSFTDVPSELPSQVVRDSENQATNVAVGLSATLEGGSGMLADLARRHHGSDQETIRRALRRLVDENHRFRGAYLVSAQGLSTAKAGRDPLRPSGPLRGEGGLVLHDIQGRVPIIYAYAPMPEGRGLVAEFDLQHLSAQLQRMDGHLRVVDVDARTILDTDGYLAFRQVTTPALQTAIGGALAGGTAGTITDVNHARSLVVSAPLAVDGPAAHLEWAIVAERPVREFALPGNGIRRAGLVVAVVACGIALLLGSWCYFFLLRPLRNLSRAAAALAAGDTASVIHPRWQDELGAIAVCLEIIRQAAVHGDQRLGGAVRMRGDDGAYTVVMPRIPADRQHGRVGTRRRT